MTKVFRLDTRISLNERSLLREFVSELGCDLAVLANDLGVKIYSDSMPDFESGFFEYAPSFGSRSGYRIVVNDSQSVARQKFTVAHELGHYVLHRNDPEFKKKTQSEAEVFDFSVVRRSNDKVFYDGDLVKFEREADDFAVSLLLPANRVKDTLEFKGGDAIGLAKRLDLSRGFVENRFIELDAPAKRKTGAVLAA